MPQRKIKQSDMLLMVDVAGGTSYGVVVCLNSWNYTQGRDTIDAKSMCGPDKSEGQPDYGLTFDGQIVLSPDSTNVGLAALQTVFNSGVEVSWKLARAVPVTGDINYTGKGALSQLDLSADDSDVAKFSGAISIHGTPTFTVTT